MKYLINKLFKKKIDYRLKEAFTIKGKRFFYFDDENNIPVSRALALMTFYDELSAKVSREYLNGYCEAMANAINEGLLTEAAILTQDLSNRNKFVQSPFLVYKLASAIFIQEGEDMYNYDFKFNEAKIGLFKSVSISDFFLTIPFSRLIGLPNFSTADLEKFTTMMEITNIEELNQVTTILRNLSTSALNQESQRFFSLLLDQHLQLSKLRN